MGTYFFLNNRNRASCASHLIVNCLFTSYTTRKYYFLVGLALDHDHDLDHTHFLTVSPRSLRKLRMCFPLLRRYLYCQSQVHPHKSKFAIGKIRSRHRNNRSHCKSFASPAIFSLTKGSIHNTGFNCYIIIINRAMSDATLRHTGYRIRKSDEILDVRRSCLRNISFQQTIPKEKRQ
jgi:hypothetical protein